MHLSLPDLREALHTSHPLLDLEYLENAMLKVPDTDTTQRNSGRVPKSGVSKHFRCLKEVRLFPKI